MLAVYKKEMRSYFTTPIGYVFMGIFLLASGFIFGLTTLQSQTSDVSEYFQIMIFAYVIVVPLLTMRSLSEERRARTEQLLLTSPLRLTSLVGAKFLAAYTMYLITAIISAFYMIPLGIYGNPNWGRVAGCYIALMLIGMCFVAIGIFVSSLTENQFVAAIGTIGLLGFFVVLGTLGTFIDSSAVKAMISWVSIYSRYTNFTYGIFDTASALYYISVAAVFLFLTVRIYERRRWN